MCARRVAKAVASPVHSAAGMDACDPIFDSADEAPDLAAALCHQLRLPLDHVLDRIQRAHDALRARNAPTIDAATLKALRCLADAHATTRHLLRVVDDVDGQAPVGAAGMRRLDVRGVVRAAAAMLPELDIAVDAPDAALANDAVVNASRPSVVKIRGVAPSCQKVLEGTGFVVGPNRVMSN